MMGTTRQGNYYIGMNRHMLSILKSVQIRLYADLDFVAEYK